MNRLQLPPRLLRATPDNHADDHRIIRRFFRLIERLERPFRAADPAPAPETKARITRLGDTTSRKPDARHS
jgi:hypothetical protein